MDRAKESYDPAVRAPLIAAVQRAVYSDVPTIILDVRKQLAAYNDDLKGWHPNSVSPFDDMLNVDI
jgi:ABC-type transport system substrate-binding protein